MPAIYEIMDITEPDDFYAIGFYFSMLEARAAIQEGPKKWWPLYARREQKYEIAIRKGEPGIGSKFEVLYARTWHRKVETTVTWR